jgi:16S rRNA (adenine1518-N6/adenine1519-N6)-dimethyltransferase
MAHVARKRFGQHFLTDGFVLGAIVDLIDPRPGQALVEIGPGLGALSRPLLDRCGALSVVELDRDLAARLRMQPGFTVIEADALNVDFAALALSAGQPLRLVGNLPYNISTPLLFHLLPAAAEVQDQHFMLQREVALRMAAAPGGKDYGRLSVMLQWRYAIETVLEVPPEAFDPPPRVHSAVVRMLPLPVGEAPALLAELVAAAFSQRRKLLRHSLGRWLESRGFSGSFDLQRRAEEVPVAQYVDLALRVEAG